MTELAERLTAPAGPTAESSTAPPAASPAVEVARRLYEGYAYGEWEPLAPLLHPYGRFVPLATAGDAVLGRDDLLALVAARPDTARLDLTHLQLTPLSDDAVLSVALPRWRRAEPVTAARAAIVTLEDGMLFRERAFATAPEAYRVFLRHGRTLGL